MEAFNVQFSPAFCYFLLSQDFLLSSLCPMSVVSDAENVGRL